MEGAFMSGVTSKDYFFSRWAPCCRGVVRNNKWNPKIVAQAIKKAVVLAGLCPDMFSFHSLRKGAVTQMKALRVDKAQILSRDEIARRMQLPYESSTNGSVRS